MVTSAKKHAQDVSLIKGNVANSIKESIEKAISHSEEYEATEAEERAALVFVDWCRAEMEVKND